MVEVANVHSESEMEDGVLYLVLLPISFHYIITIITSHVVLSHLQ